jgi:hypothetical protein
MNHKNPMHGAIEEPLQDLARMAWDHSKSLCDPQHGCTNYHRAWSLVRLISLDGALPGASAFFIEEIARRITGGARRILISGSADTGLLAVVAQAIRRAGQSAQIVIVDRCKTPLQQCRNYASMLGLPVEFHECDVRALEIDPVDVVIAHSFLLFFPEPDRQQVIDSWARLTQKGAAVLLFSPISPDEHTHPMRLDRDAIPGRAASLANAAVVRGWHEAERADLASDVARFWNESTGISKMPHTTADNLRRGLEQAGFRVLQVTPPLPQSATNGPLGVSATHTDNRAELVAVRI